MWVELLLSQIIVVIDHSVHYGRLLLGYNLPLSKTMLDSLWSTVRITRNELNSGWFKNVCFWSVYVTVRFCHRLLLALLSVCQFSYGFL